MFAQTIARFMQVQTMNLISLYSLFYVLVMIKASLFSMAFVSFPRSPSPE